MRRRGRTRKEVVGVRGEEVGGGRDALECVNNFPWSRVFTPRGEIEGVMGTSEV